MLLYCPYRSVSASWDHFCLILFNSVCLILTWVLIQHTDYHILLVARKVLVGAREIWVGNYVL